MGWEAHFEFGVVIVAGGMDSEHIQPLHFQGCYSLPEMIEIVAHIADNLLHLNRDYY